MPIELPPNQDALVKMFTPSRNMLKEVVEERKAREAGQQAQQAAHERQGELLSGEETGQQQAGQEKQEPQVFQGVQPARSGPGSFLKDPTLWATARRIFFLAFSLAEFWFSAEANHISAFCTNLHSVVRCKTISHAWSQRTGVCQIRS